jgi:hypothetical protein
MGEIRGDVLARIQVVQSGRRVALLQRNVEGDIQLSTGSQAVPSVGVEPWPDSTRMKATRHE